jgi:hypothetical protein
MRGDESERGGARREKEEKKEGVEKTGYCLHLMNMGEGVLTVFKYPVYRFHQDELRWSCMRGLKIARGREFI